MLVTSQSNRQELYLPKNVKSKVYGIDLDGVCVDFVLIFSAWLKAALGLSYNDSAITDYHWHKCDLGISKEDFWREFDRFGKDFAMYEALSPMQDSKAGIDYLLNNAKDVWFITGRPHYAYEQTVNSLQREFGVSSDHIIFSSGGDYKSNVVNRLGIDVFIDDAPHYVKSLNENTSAKVYLMDATYNKNVDAPGITRVSGWKEFISKETKGEDSNSIIW